MQADQLNETFAAVDAELASLERRLGAREGLPLEETVQDAIALIKRLVIAHIVDEGRKVPADPAVDLLDAFKILVKGEPAWNAIRDHCRELVYYRICINMGRKDALPEAAEKMAIRTARHIFLYMRTRCIHDGRVKH